MGKVHGSLARAGKVKSQTPKVSGSSTSYHQRQSTNAISGTKANADFSRSSLKRRRSNPRVVRRRESHTPDDSST